MPFWSEKRLISLSYDWYLIVPRCQIVVKTGLNSDFVLQPISLLSMNSDLFFCFRAEIWIFFSLVKNSVSGKIHFVSSIRIPKSGECQNVLEKHQSQFSNSRSSSTTAFISPMEVKIQTIRYFWSNTTKNCHFSAWIGVLKFRNAGNISILGYLVFETRPSPEQPTGFPSSKSQSKISYLFW